MKTEIPLTDVVVGSGLVRNRGSSDLLVFITSHLFPDVSVTELLVKAENKHSFNGRFSVTHWHWSQSEEESQRPDLVCMKAEPCDSKTVDPSINDKSKSCFYLFSPADVITSTCCNQRTGSHFTRHVSLWTCEHVSDGDSPHSFIHSFSLNFILYSELYLKWSFISLNQSDS